LSGKEIKARKVNPSELLAQEYEAATGYGSGDRVRLGDTEFGVPGTEGIIVGVELDLRDHEIGPPTSDPCFRVRLASGSVVYLTPDQFELSSR
jgi:hypothetical protein